MTKRVNVYAQVAIRTITPPIYGTCKDIIMTTGDILKCICKRARVEEILPDGRTVRLNLRNYYTDNGAGLDAKANVKKEEKNPEAQPARFKVPVAPSTSKAQVVETNKTDDNEKQDSINAVETTESDEIENADVETAYFGTVFIDEDPPVKDVESVTITSTDSAETISVIIDNDTIATSAESVSENTITTTADSVNSTPTKKTSSSRKRKKK